MVPELIGLLLGFCVIGIAVKVSRYPSEAAIEEKQKAKQIADLSEEFPCIGHITICDICSAAVVVIGRHGELSEDDPARLARFEIEHFMATGCRGSLTAQALAGPILSISFDDVYEQTQEFLQAYCRFVSAEDEFKICTCVRSVRDCPVSAHKSDRRPPPPAPMPTKASGPGIVCRS